MIKSLPAWLLLIFFCFPVQAENSGVVSILSRFSGQGKSLDIQGIGTLVNYDDQRYFLITVAHLGAGQSIYVPDPKGSSWIQVPTIDAKHLVNYDLSVLEIQPEFARSQISTSFHLYLQDMVKNGLQRPSPQPVNSYRDFIAFEGEANSLLKNFTPAIVSDSSGFIYLSPKSLTSKSRIYRREKVQKDTFAGLNGLGLGNERLFPCRTPTYLSLSHEYEFCGTVVEGVSGSPFLQVFDGKGEPPLFLGPVKQYDLYRNRSYAVSTDIVISTLKAMLKRTQIEPDLYRIELQNGGLVRVSNETPNSTALREIVDLRMRGSMSWLRGDSGRGASRSDGGASVGVGNSQNDETLFYQYLKNGKPVHSIEVYSRLTNKSFWHFLPDLPSRVTANNLNKLIPREYGTREHLNLPNLHDMLEQRIARASLDWRGRWQIMSNPPGEHLPTSRFAIKANTSRLWVDQNQFRLEIKSPFEYPDETITVVFSQETFKPIVIAESSMHRKFFVDLHALFFDSFEDFSQALNTNEPIALSPSDIANTKPKVDIMVDIGKANSGDLHHLHFIGTER